MKDATSPQVGLVDVAREAGVSPTLVSRILRGKRGNVRFSKQTEERVIRVADELGYVPRRDAQNLKRQRSRTLALLSPQQPSGQPGEDAWGNHFLHQILCGTEAACQEHDYNCLYAHWSMNEKDRSHPRIMLDRSVDGVVLTDFTLSSVVDHLLATGVRCAQVGSNIDPACDIDRYYGDLEGAVCEIAARYYEQGHRRIVLYRPIGFGPEAIEAAFLECTRAMPGLDARSVDCGRFADRFAEGEAARLAACDERPTAMICPNGQFAFALAASLAPHGLICPRDYCMIAWVSAGWPVSYLPGSGAAFSTIELPNHIAAYHAASDLIEDLESPYAEAPDTPSRSHTWPCQILWRDSTDPSACLIKTP
ncbi:MAG: LacI family DNA-binding transcriptional regulator [Planctomycetota bacterium]